MPFALGRAVGENAFTRAVDRITDVVGRGVAWLAVIMTLIGAYNAIVRYLGRFFGWNLSSNLYLELQWYLFSVIFLLGAAYALKEDSHVRVDILFQKMDRRAQARTNVLGSIFLLLPFSLFTLWVSWPSVRNSFAVREASPDPGGLARYPLKALILVCFALLLLQGLSELIKEWHIWRHGTGEEEPDAGDGEEVLV